jgi:arylsulfatase A-like enzyme
MRVEQSRRDFMKTAGCAASGVMLGGLSSAQGFTPNRPNILWILVEDMSPDLGCYDNPIIHTPNLDKLANQGVRYTQAFTTSPVCSPSRSALLTGMYQTTLGAHHHRSQSDRGKGTGEVSFHPSYYLPDAVHLITHYFHRAGYFTANVRTPAPGVRGKGKTDFNFLYHGKAYDRTDWNQRQTNQPFFAHVNLGLTHRPWERDKLHPIAPDRVRLPPYCPDHPEVRKDWAGYIESIQVLDAQAGKILKRLEEEGLVENTVVIFMSDHGGDHIKGKYWLFDGGIRVPLIIRWLGRIRPGTVSDDLVSAVDVSATMLAMAGIPLPKHLSGRNFLDPKIPRRDYVFAARDRIDETVEIIRAVRSKKFKYLRNYTPFAPYLQSNNTKDREVVARTVLRQWKQLGKLTSAQVHFSADSKPFEELYDLEHDPHEIRNLAALSDYQDVLEKFRFVHREHMLQSGDVGLIPEPELEELGKQYGHKSAILSRSENRNLIPDILSIIETSQRSNVEELLRALADRRASVRYWAAVGLGSTGQSSPTIVSALQNKLADASGTVRVGAADALSRLGHIEKALPVLTRELDHKNHAVRLYAIHALETLGPHVRDVLQAIRVAEKGPYEYVRRVASRILKNLATS